MPTPRRAKKIEASPNQNAHRNRNRVLSIIGILVILSMSLTLVIQPGGGSVRPSSTQPPATSAPGELTQEQLIATINALQATSAAADTPVPALSPTAPVTGTPALSPAAPQSPPRTP